MTDQPTTPTFDGTREPVAAVLRGLGANVPDEDHHTPTTLAAIAHTMAVAAQNIATLTDPDSMPPGPEEWAQASRLLTCIETLAHVVSALTAPDPDRRTLTTTLFDVSVSLEELAADGRA